MALTAGQDTILLDEGHFYGFGVDGGTGCFFDADALAAMGAIAEGSFETIAAVGIGGETAELVDPESGANLIAFSSGWGDGSYPTWIGRTADGRVACFVADMLILNKAEPVP